MVFPRETQEMLFAAHDAALHYWGGVPRQGIYDNLKTSVDQVLDGKERRFNPRFLALMSHYVIEPVACTPASGWEKGQVEKQVQDVRRRCFPPPGARSTAWPSSTVGLSRSWSRWRRHAPTRTTPRKSVAALHTGADHTARPGCALQWLCGAGATC
ncbi:transposase family protein [Aeromonas dhakensis]|nr:transposase family protein [Aeromonas dhakensis]